VFQSLALTPSARPGLTAALLLTALLLTAPTGLVSSRCAAALGLATPTVALRLLTLLTGLVRVASGRTTPTALGTVRGRLALHRNVVVNRRLTLLTLLTGLVRVASGRTTPTALGTVRGRLALHRNVVVNRRLTLLLATPRALSFNTASGRA
jgi:hypothetical protein